MAVTLRLDIDDELLQLLEKRAAALGRSVEDEVSAILREWSGEDLLGDCGLGTRIAYRFAGIGLESAEEIPELRGYPVQPATFDE